MPDNPNTTKQPEEQPEEEAAKRRASGNGFQITLDFPVSQDIQDATDHLADAAASVRAATKALKRNMIRKPDEEL